MVITGAGSGLGASLAKKYAAEGHFVTLLGRRVEKLEEVAASFSHSDYAIHSLDVSVYQDVVEIFAEIEKAKPIDRLINNAGVGHFALAEEISVEQTHQMIDVNLKGTIFCTQQVLAGMKTRNSGSIINIVSTAGLEGKVTEAVYSASKFGVKGFTESIVEELSETDIRVTAVYMGGMHTPFWDGLIDEANMGGMMHPDDIADIIMANISIRRNINVPQVVIKNH